MSFGGFGDEQDYDEVKRLRTELTAANRQIVDLQLRIKELEENLNTISTHAGHLFPGITIHEIFDSYAAERTALVQERLVSDKLVAALSEAGIFLNVVRSYAQEIRPANELETDKPLHWKAREAQDRIGGALAEVAAIRAKT